MLNPCSTANLEGLDFTPEFTPLETGFVWYLQWGLFGLDDPAVSHTTASIAPSLEIGTVLYRLQCSYAEYSTLHKCGYIINQVGFKPNIHYEHEAHYTKYRLEMGLNW